MLKDEERRPARAAEMRNLDDASRDEAILAAVNVLDLRARLTENAKQRAIGAAYRFGPAPKDIA